MSTFLILLSATLLGLAIGAVPKVVVESSTATSAVQTDVMTTVVTTKPSTIVDGTLAGNLKPSNTVTKLCDLMCTKLEYDPVCATNGRCVHDFANQCIMDTYNCKHPQQKFVLVSKKEQCSDNSMRRCTSEDLKL